MAHNNYGIELMKSGDLQGAREQFREAMRLDPAAADWVGIGQCYAIAGDYATACQMYQKAIDATPASTEPVFQHVQAGNEFQLGTAYQGLAGEFPKQAPEYFAKAESAYRQAVKLFPEYEDPRTNLASILVEQKRYAEAINECQTVLMENPESFSAYMNMGNAYYAQGKLDEALGAYLHAMHLQPVNANTLASVGAILAQRGNIEAGIAMLQQALQIDPQNAIARQNLLAALARRSH
jgi:tetratricopeptide (TPR) repeat protein